MLKSHETAYMLSNGVGMYRCGTALINSERGYVSVMFEEEPAFFEHDIHVESGLWYWRSNQ